MSSIKRDVKETIAYVKALPDEVAIELKAPEGFITTKEAFKLAKVLKKAAKESRHLDWLELEDGDLELVATA